MPFKINGNSGYGIHLDDNVVTKSAKTNDDKLIGSAVKQKEFVSQFFKAPTVFEINKNSFTMEYINGESFIEFFTRSSKRELDELIRKLDGYLKEIIVGEMDIPTQILKEKVEHFPDAKKLKSVINSLDTINVKVGLCHGDLTFSNMIFVGDVYLIDFLGSYLESPTMDIIKLRQDTHLYWSLNMSDCKRDSIKIKIGLEYIDEWLRNEYPVENYNILQAINLYRIYPYTKDEKIKTYLKENINKLCAHL